MYGCASVDGTINYTLTNKISKELQLVIKQGKKILVLINPPYAKVANTLGNEGKIDVATTKIGLLMNNKDYGYAARELFVQFLVRISVEIPNVTTAIFSTLKYVNAPNFDKFREIWNAKYLDGFIVHSKAFDELKDDFPIGFLIWKTNQNAKKKTPITEITAEILDKKTQPIGEKKFYNLPNNY